MKTKQKALRRSLWASVAAILLCAAVLLGTTFAWFTDTVSSTGNKIQSGTLEIELKGGTGEEKTLFTTDADTLWEPGRSQKANATVSNVGTLWLKYGIAVENLVLSENTADITEVLDVYVTETESPTQIEGYTKVGTLRQAIDGEVSFGTDGKVGVLAPKGKDGSSKQFGLLIKMQESAGNQYQNCTAEFTVVVKATQWTAEKDGFQKDQYDAEAPLDFTVVKASSAADVTAAIEEAEEGAVLTIESAAPLTEPLTIDKPVTIQNLETEGTVTVNAVGTTFQNLKTEGAVTVNGDGTTFENAQIGKGVVTLNADTTFKDCAISKPENSNKSASSVYVYDGAENVAFDGCTFVDPQWEAVQITSNDVKEVTVTNCTFSAANVDGAASSYGNTADQAIRFIHVQPSGSPTVKITITNNTFKVCGKVKDSVAAVYYVSTDSTITVGGNTFEGWAEGDVKTEDGREKTGKLSIGWPEVEELKFIENWTGENKTFTINGNA